MSTVAAWLDARRPAPPRALSLRAREVLASAGGLDAPCGAQPFLAAAEGLLAGMLRGGSLGRECALDLLVADALVTWAFEAAAGGGDVDAVARGAMARIAALSQAPRGAEAVA